MALASLGDDGNDGNEVAGVARAAKLFGCRHVARFGAHLESQRGQGMRTSKTNAMDKVWASNAHGVHRRQAHGGGKLWMLVRGGPPGATGVAAMSSRCAREWGLLWWQRRVQGWLWWPELSWRKARAERWLGVQFPVA